MNYDDWKATDPADSDPYRDDYDERECAECGALGEECCQQGCGCVDCCGEEDD